MKALSFHTDNKLFIRSWDEDIATFTGQPASRAIGYKYFDVFPRIYRDNKDALAEVIKKKKSVSLKEYPFNCLYGCIKANVKITPLKSRDRKVNGAKALIYPLSTCTVATELHQSQKLIDIGKIASTLAHGVRNPLNAIKGAVVYLREKYDTEEPLIEFTKIMEDEISRLEDFISRFLSSSVSETDAKETNINALLKRIEAFTALQIYTRNIRSHYEFGNIPPITINSFHLEQAVLNVINNAIVAMGSGGSLSISTSTEERAGRIFVVITVSDTGPGMRDGITGDFPVENRTNGKGFGLFITYEILKHYGGHLEIDSKKDSGTTIKLFIPSQHST